MDTLTPLERSRRMSLIRGKDTRPEVALRSTLHSLGYRFRIHRRDLPGSPDIVFPPRKRVIFVHGCFWHGHEGCKTANMPKSRTEYWKQKFTRNQARDQENERRLCHLGWEVLVVWECEMKEKPQVIRRLVAFLDSPIRAQ